MATYDPPQPLWKRNIAGILDFLFCLAIFGPSLNLAFGVSRHPVVVTNSAGAVITYPLFNLSGWPGLICIGLTILYFLVLDRGGGTVFQRLFRMRRRGDQIKRPWTVIGGLFLVLLIADGGMLYYAGKLDAESKAYAEAALPKVLSNPTSENFVSFMAPQDKATFNAANAEKFFLYMNQTLGPSNLVII